MEPKMHLNAYEVLFSFIIKLRWEFVRRNPNFTPQDFEKGVPVKFFEGSLLASVICPSCGPFDDTGKFLSTVIDDVLSEESVAECVLETLNGICSCGRQCIDVANAVAECAPYFLVHCRRPCSAQYKLPLKMNIYGSELEFHCCITQSISNVEFLSLGPNGRVTIIEDEEVQTTSANILESNDWQDKFLTVVYSTSTKTSQQKVVTPPMLQRAQKASNRSMNKNKFKVIGLPKVDRDLITGLPEHPRTRTVATQTEKIKVADASVQSDKVTQHDPHKRFLSYDKCRHHKKFQFFTGLEPAEFEALHDLIGGEEIIRSLKLKYRPDTPSKIIQSSLSSRDRLFIFLLRLRRGLPLQELEFCFNVVHTYIGEVCYAMTRLIYEVFKTMEERCFVSAAAQNKRKPKVMRPFNNLRAILDGASFYIQAPSNFQMQGNNYSEYKSHTVILFILGVSCHGSTIFCSKGFEGNMSDKKALLTSSEFVDRLNRGDAIMVDRGFEVTAEMLKMGVHVIQPPPKGHLIHLNEEQELFTAAVAAARIYVEHMVADVKDNRLLQGIIPLTLHPILPQLVYIAAYLRNFSNKKIKDTKVQVVLDDDDS